MKAHPNHAHRSSRRGILGRGAALAVAAFAAGCNEADRGAEPRARNGRLKQSICQWCFQKHWDLEALCKVAKELGCESIELVAPSDYPTLKRHGLACALAGSHWFDKGMNNPKYHEMCVAKIREAVDLAAAAGVPNVITFTGLREDIADDAGARNCVDGLKKVIRFAEEKRVTLVLEMLNSRVPENMIGVPGYQGDHLDYCADIVRKVGSPRMKLLFDVFHVQIMDGDLLARIRKYAEYIGHVHTAGNPGRHELDDTQEIAYRAVFRALAEIKYAGYVGHEFIPTSDPLEGLRHAVALATV